MASKITSKGQVTIPKAVRDHLGLKEGDEVTFTLAPDGRVVVHKQVDPASRARILCEARKHIVLDMPADQYLALTRGDDWNSPPRVKTKPRPARKGRAA